MQQAAVEGGGGDRGTGYAMAGFVAMAFAVVGMTGLLAAHVSRLPLERAMAREVVLDQALGLARAGDAAGLEAMRPRLGDSAVILGAMIPGAMIPGAMFLAAGADFEARVAAERVAMRARRLAEADATATRLRALLVVVTIVAAAFGAAAMLAGHRAGAGRVAAGGKAG